MHTFYPNEVSTLWMTSYFMRLRLFDVIRMAFDACTCINIMWLYFIWIKSMHNASIVKMRNMASAMIGM